MEEFGLSQKDLQKLNLVFAHRDIYSYRIHDPYPSTCIKAKTESNGFACESQNYLLMTPFEDICYRSTVRVDSPEIVRLNDHDAWYQVSYEITGEVNSRQNIELITIKDLKDDGSSLPIARPVIDINGNYVILKKNVGCVTIPGWTNNFIVKNNSRNLSIGLKILHIQPRWKINPWIANACTSNNCGCGSNNSRGCGSNNGCGSESNNGCGSESNNGCGSTKKGFYLKGVHVYDTCLGENGMTTRTVDARFKALADRMRGDYLSFSNEPCFGNLSSRMDVSADEVPVGTVNKFYITGFKSQEPPETYLDELYVGCDYTYSFLLSKCVPSKDGDAFLQSWNETKDKDNKPGQFNVVKKLGGVYGSYPEGYPDGTPGKPNVLGYFFKGVEMIENETIFCDVTVELTVSFFTDSDGVSGIEDLPWCDEISLKLGGTAQDGDPFKVYDKNYNETKNRTTSNKIPAIVYNGDIGYYQYTMSITNNRIKIGPHNEIWLALYNPMLSAQFKYRRFRYNPVFPVEQSNVINAITGSITFTKRS